MTFGSPMANPSSKMRPSTLDKLKQSNAAKLELETKKMEERIRSLKEKMMKEKQERERLGGTRWTSGKTMVPSKPNQKPFASRKTSSNEVTKKAPRKIKVLCDVPIETYIQKPKQHFVDNSEVKNCGQCEKNVSAWVCRECSEYYCDPCFSQFHQKGALRKHTKSSIGNTILKKSEDERTPSSPTRIRNDNDLLQRSSSETIDVSSHSNRYPNGVSLLNGSYNEEESAASFAQALQEWRNQGQVSKSSPQNHVTCADTSCGTPNQAINESEGKKRVLINFHSSMSYGERLFLKKGREDLSRKKEMISNKKEMKNVLNKKLSSEVSDKDQQDDQEEIDEFSPNYREIIRNMATTSSYKDNIKDDTNSLPSHHVPCIQEVSSAECNSKEEKGITCIVEECEKETSKTKTRPVTQHGHLSILEMSSKGDFSEPRLMTKLDNCLELAESPRYVSSSLSSRPFHLKLTNQMKAKKKPVRAKSAECKQRKQTRLLANKNQKKVPQKPVGQVWKPKPNHKELSEFFLAGVKKRNECPNELAKNKTEETRHLEGNLDSSCLSKKWHPHHSYPATSSSVSADPSYPVRIGEHQSIMASQPAGITGRNFRCSGEDYSQKGDIGPSLSYSEHSLEQSNHTHDQDEDIVGISVNDMDDFGTGNQDEDDMATLNDLAWELESSTGRLTRCEQDINDLDKSDDEDSIEDKECGSGLTSPCTLERSATFHESMMDDFEEMERRFMEEDF